MVKQLKSSEIKKYFEVNPKTVLLDVRTENEWSSLGKPLTENFNLKAYFITLSPDLSKWQEIDVNFIEKVKKQIGKENEILVMCAAGGRSMIAADLLEKEGYTTHNISDGFSGNGIDLGWKKEGLPSG